MKSNLDILNFIIDQTTKSIQKPKMFVPTPTALEAKILTDLTLIWFIMRTDWNNRDILQRWIAFASKEVEGYKGINWTVADYLNDQSNMDYDWTNLSIPLDKFFHSILRELGLEN